jgi:hypothetical protein
MRALKKRGITQTVTKLDSDYDAPRMRGIAFWNADWFRFRCFGAGGKD